ncbi:MAG: hypothetical protein QOE70_3053 [Chthoniobacter sp.]|jgi:hypothetical protein|nr:hypothetical protein [Chthoniobacter sp.]
MSLIFVFDFAHLWIASHRFLKIRLTTFAKLSFVAAFRVPSYRCSGHPPMRLYFSNMIRSIAHRIKLTARPFLVVAGLSMTIQAAPLPVHLTPGKGMTRGDKPYFIKGVGGDTRLEVMKECGVNSFRTWSDGNLAALLPQAAQLDLTVCAGIWLELECPWFSYSNPDHCERQAQRVCEIVRRWREAPALLCWGLGNESEGDGTNDAYWRQLGRLARLVQQEDPAHPTFTALAGLSAAKVAGLNKHAPSLDFVGINTYGGLPSMRDQVASLQWKRPWVVTEFGAQGFWERPKAPWGAPIEQTSSEKARSIRLGYAKTIAPGGDCLGGYAFVWGQKQESTATWFGLLTKSGERTAAVDVLQELWTGHAPANRAPEVEGLISPAAQKTVAPSEVFSARLMATDPDGDVLTYSWEVMSDEAVRDKDSRELPLEPIPGCADDSKSAEAMITAPKEPGNYRIFGYASDGKGHAGTMNMPFQVK